MPLRLPDRLPAIELLKKENIFVMDESRAHSQMVRPLKIVVLNLMPLKITTETDLIRLLSNTPLQIEINFMKLKSHTPKNTPVEHMMMFYKDFDILKRQKWDGMIVTGAPIELLDFEDVEYWQEIMGIFDWARTHVTSTLYICWAAQASLYHFYGVPKHRLPKKMFGVFHQRVLVDHLPIFRGFDDEFMMPHSRHTEIHRADLEQVPELTILAESAESGVSMVMARNGREFSSPAIWSMPPTRSTRSIGATLASATMWRCPATITATTIPRKARWLRGAPTPTCFSATGSTITFTRKRPTISTRYSNIRCE